MSALNTLLKAECRRSLLLCIRKPSQVLNPVLFFLLVISLFPLGMSVDKTVLHQVAAGLVWVAALLSILLSLERLFQLDFDSGVLEQDVIQATPLPLIVLVKIFIFWLMTVVPLLLLSPLLGGMLGLTAHEIMVLMLSLLVGTPVVIMIAAILAALTVGLGSQSVLLSLLLLPLTIPVLIFGAGSVVVSAQGVSALPLLLLMSALCLVSFSLGPFVVAGALRLVDY